jgi:hypothetical protein
MRDALIALCACLAALLPGSVGASTVEERVAQFGAAARGRLAPYFARARLAYPPREVVLVGLKAEQRLELYAAGSDGRMRFLRSYPVLAASGKMGPKLRSGDRQVPEGLYRISALNPDSQFHLSLRIDYPNAHDLRRAAEEGRTDLGGDIMIHGGRISIGCLAMGDPVAEELFVLAAETGLANLRVILSPLDFRRTRLARLVKHTLPWTPALYADIRAALAELP